jgi:hypothetical protein
MIAVSCFFFYLNRADKSQLMKGVGNWQMPRRLIDGLPRSNSLALPNPGNPSPSVPRGETRAFALASAREFVQGSRIKTEARLNCEGWVRLRV